MDVSSSKFAAVAIDLRLINCGALCVNSCLARWISIAAYRRLRVYSLLLHRLCVRYVWIASFCTAGVLPHSHDSFAFLFLPCDDQVAMDVSGGGGEVNASDPIPRDGISLKVSAPLLCIAYDMI